MKNLILFLSLLLGYYVILNSCANLKEAKLLENPDFELHAEKYIITSPVSPTLGNNTYILVNQLLDKVYEMNVKTKGSTTNTIVIDEEKNNSVHITKTKEITSRVFYVFNPVDSSEYKIDGKLTSYRTRNEESKWSSESSDFVYPIEFQIFDDGNSVGKISLVKHRLNDTQIIRTPLEITLHNNEYYVEHQNMLNKVTVSFEDDSGLIALFGLKPKSFITTKMQGDVLIKQGLSEDIKSDIFSIYLMVEGVVSHKDIGL